MNAIEASDRLRILDEAIRPLESAIDNERDYGNMSGKYSLEVILREVKAEQSELQRKLSEVIL